MPTRKLFHEDAYRTQFSAQVLSCVPAGESWDVVLDQTAFYAESGGQPSDSGRLGGQKVLALRELEDGTIVHAVDGPLSGEVAGQIDWERRLDHMEQHTGQHLLSGAFEQLFDAETVSWHLGSETTTVDLTIETLTPEQAERIELECNRIIRAGLPVLTHVTDDQGIGRFPLRKPPAVTGEIRVVELQGYDWSACAGTHVRSTGELGLLKIKSWERYKKTTRVTFLAGRRALADYLALDLLTRDLCRSLSIGVPDLPKYVERTQEEMSTLRKRMRTLQEQILEQEAQSLLAGARRVGNARVVRQTFVGRPIDELKLLAAKVAAQGGAVAVFGTKGAMPQVILHRAVDVRVDVGQVIKQVLPLIDGRGGGSPIQAQGGGSRGEQLEHALDTAIALIGETMK
ncbi:MAG: alanyl-tRNA editing protein [Bacillota bacterium]